MKKTNDYLNNLSKDELIKENMYFDSMRFIFKNNLEIRFEQRARKIVDDTDGIGWGFHDGLGDIFEQNYRK